MVRERIANVRQQIAAARRVPLLQKAAAAERILEDLGGIIDTMAAKLEAMQLEIAQLKGSNHE